MGRACCQRVHLGLAKLPPVVGSIAHCLAGIWPLSLASEVPFEKLTSWVAQKAKSTSRPHRNVFPQRAVTGWEQAHDSAACTKRAHCWSLNSACRKAPRPSWLITEAAMDWHDNLGEESRSGAQWQRQDQMPSLHHAEVSAAISAIGQSLNDHHALCKRQFPWTASCCSTAISILAE